VPREANLLNDAADAVINQGISSYRVVYNAISYPTEPICAVIGHNGLSFGGVLAKVRRSPVEYVMHL
jgi:hypothetical protein